MLEAVDPKLNGDEIDLFVSDEGSADGSDGFGNPKLNFEAAVPFDAAGTEGVDEAIDVDPAGTFDWVTPPTREKMDPPDCPPSASGLVFCSVEGVANENVEFVPPAKGTSVVALPAAPKILRPDDGVDVDEVEIDIEGGAGFAKKLDGGGTLGVVDAAVFG